MHMLGKLAKGMKDGALGIALKAYLNDRLNAYGEVLDCSVDTGKGRIAVRALLKGEKEAINVAVEKYELAREGEQVFATLRSFSSSRPWLTLLLGKLLTDKRYKLPSAVGGLL
jgi:predicted transcriptional regulator